MAISPIANGEAGASVRTKINLSFIEANKVVGIESDIDDLANDLTAAEVQTAKVPDLVIGEAALSAGNNGRGWLGRPGETPTRFSETLTGELSGRAPLDVGTVVQTDALGSALRIAGDDVDGEVGYITIAPRAAFAIEPDRIYRLRAKFARATDPVDPAGNAVELRAQNLTKNKASVSNVRIGSLYYPTVAGGPVEIVLLIGDDEANEILNYVVPATTRYFTPGIRIYGNGQATDLAVLEWEDITGLVLGGADVEALTIAVDNVLDTVSGAAAAAEAAADNAADSEIAAAGSATAASGSATAAASSATDAEAAETAAAASAAQAALYEGFRFDNATDVIADTALTYTGGSASTVVSGDYVQTKEEGYSYEVLASDAVDPPVVTAGNINLIPKAGCLTPGMFGVVDNSALATDQSTKLQRWLTVCAEEFRAPHTDKPIRVLSQEPLTYVPGSVVPGFINLSRMRLHFDFDGGLSIGAVGATFGLCELYTPYISRRGTLTWLADERASRLSDNAGLILYNTVGCTLHVAYTYGFTNGYVLHSEDGFASYNTVHVGLVQDCRYAEVLRSIAGASPGAGFTNENTFIGGARRQTSSANLLGNAYGTVLTASDTGYKGNNTNRWLSPCYELGSPAGATYRVPVLLDRSGVYNVWQHPRHEVGKGPFGIADNGSGITANAACLNRVELLYEAGDAATGFYAGWLQVAGAFGNTCEHVTNSPKAVWHSGPMASRVSAGGSANPKIDAPFFFKNGATPSRSSTAGSHVVTNAECLHLASNVGAFVEVDTRKTKTFRLTGAFLPSYAGRYQIQAFGTPPAWSAERLVSIGMHVTNDSGKVYVCDQAGTTATSGGPTGTSANITDGTARWDYAGVLADFAGGAPLIGVVTDSWGTEEYVKGPSAKTTAYGGSYQPTADNVTNVIFTVREDVTKVHIGYAGGTNPCALRDMSIQAFPVEATLAGVGNAYQTVNLGDPLPATSSRFRVATAKPDTSGLHGFYSDGEIVGASGATSTTTMGWLANPGGALAAAWVSSTAYAVPGHCVVNDSGKVYKLVTAGTSAASGGPTGTGKGITDNTCVWDYLCLKAVFAALPNLP